VGAILQTSDYPSIRAKLGVTTDDLPDVDIDTIGLLPYAEAMVTSLVADYVTILAGGGANKTFLQAGTLCLCGALAVAKLEMQRGQAFKEGDYSESETKVDWGAKRAELLLESKKCLLSISTHTHIRRTLFSATGPTSSSSNWPSEVQRWFARIQPHVLTWLSDSGLKKYSWENQP
jgi:hypothetical protein